MKEISDKINKAIEKAKELGSSPELGKVLINEFNKLTKVIQDFSDKTCPIDDVKNQLIKIEHILYKFI